MRILGLLLTALALVAVGFAAGERTSRRDAIPRAEWKQRIRAALVEDDPLAQADTLAAILPALGPDDLEVALEAYEDSFAHGGGGRQSFELLMEAWSRIDAAGAFVRVNTWPTDYQRLALPALLHAVARAQPRDALSALDQIADPRIRGDAHDALIQGWAASRAPGLWHHLASVEPERSREQLSNLAMSALVRRMGAAGLLAEVEGLSEEPPLDGFKQVAIRTAVSVAARVDPEAATTFFERHRGGPYDVRLMRRVAVNWVTRDGRSAMAWVRAQPAGDERDRVAREAFRRWLVRDRAAAVAWMGALADHGDLAAIYDMYASALTRDDPHAAIRWVDSEIGDPEPRREALLDVARVWLGQDREAARRWLEERGLAPEIDREAELRRARLGMRAPVEHRTQAPRDINR